MNSPRALLAVLIVVGVAAVSAAWALASEAPDESEELQRGGAIASETGCQSATESPFEESDPFTPYEQMRAMPQAPIMREGSSVVEDLSPSPLLGRDDFAGLALIWEEFDETTSYSYFGRAPLEDAMTSADFHETGGFEFHIEALDPDQESFASHLLKEIPERAVAVNVGASAGAMTWADPLVNGVRTFNLYWSDGTYNFALISSSSAEEVITHARAVACE